MKPIVLKEPQGKHMCSICGKEEDPSHWINEDEMREHRMCFTCNFWREMLEKDSKRAPHTYCMIDGTHYVIEPDEPNAAFQGFGGAEFQIEFFDGTKVVTHNLWCQGEPEHPYWKEKFPDNARFERNFKWINIHGIKHLVEK